MKSKKGVVVVRAMTSVSATVAAPAAATSARAESVAVAEDAMKTADEGGAGPSFVCRRASKKSMLDKQIQQDILQKIAASREQHLRVLSGKVGAQADREDILQQAYNRAIRYIHTLRDEERWQGWFGLILRRSVADFYASSQRERQGREGLSNEPVMATTLLSTAPSSLLHAVSAAPLFEVTDESYRHTSLCHCGEKMIEELPADTIELVRRVDLDDESPSEAAKALGISANLARVRLHRAHARIREKLQDHCVTTGDGTRYEDYLDCRCVEC